MKALMLIVIAASQFQQHPDGGMAIWFTDMAACAKAKPIIQRSLPDGLTQRWSKISCVPISQ